MAVRQYIGARYVPKFFEGPGGSNEWVNGIKYEPLTIVTFLNTSFTSKKEVPASVGSPNENPEYWVATGNYNAQVESYREEVFHYSEEVAGVVTEVERVAGDVTDLGERVEDDETIISGIAGRVTQNEEDIAELKEAVIAAVDKKYVIIGDSYGNESTHPNNILTYLRQSLGSDNVVYANCTSGNGFYKTDGGASTGNGFLSQLQSCPDSVDKDTVTDIIVFGGMNDRHAITDSAQATLNSNITAFMNYAKTTFKNATVSVFMVGVTRVRSTAALLLGVDTCYKTAAKSTNGRYMVGAAVLGRNYANFDNDNHPNSTGFKCIAEGMLVGLACGYCEYSYPNRLECMLSDVTGSGGTIGGSKKIISQRYKSAVRVMIDSGINFVFDTPYAVNGNLNNVRFNLAELDNNRFFNSPDLSQYQLTNCRLKLGDDSFVMADYAFFHIEEVDGKLLFRPLITRLASGSWSIKEIQFYANAFVYSSEEC